MSETEKEIKYKYVDGSYCPECKRELEPDENQVCYKCGNSSGLGGTIIIHAVLRYKLYDNRVWWKPWTNWDYGWKFDGIKETVKVALAKVV